MALLSVTGLPLPLDNTFDFVAWMARPADWLIPADMDLQARNEWNYNSELANRTSICETKLYQFALSPTAPASSTNGINVGARLIPFYQYAPAELELMVDSPYYCEKAVAPLPLSMVTYVVKERAKKVAAAETERLKKEKERADREKEKEKEKSAHVARVGDNTRLVSSFHFHKLYPPIHWFTDDKLRLANERPHEMHLKQIRPAATLTNLSPDKVTVIDIAKHISLWGSDDTTDRFSTHAWTQGSGNFLKALQRLCPAPDPANPMFAHEYEQHFLFFSGLEDFEADFHIWYPIEKKLRLAILNKAQFVEATWVVKVQVAVSSFKAAKELARASALIPTKRLADVDLHSGSQKAQKTLHNFDNAGSFRNNSNSFRDQEAPRGPRERDNGDRRPPICLLCAAAHKVHDHPANITKFRDGKPLLCERQGNAMWTVAGVQGRDSKSVCVLYNIGGRGCDDRHSSDRLHICSLCRKEHPALSRNSNCVRFHNGEYRP
ncbi:hypothetical protein B0H10DRAFT_2213865 [Mycena sp. CBHHK59/15]|nr:hypothetical protein B0H10DRAFT_2213865 [Mycena sp. CBHHK59/15]